jgi:hypothetical protein
MASLHHHGETHRTMLGNHGGRLQEQAADTHIPAHRLQFGYSVTERKLYVDWVLQAEATVLA